MKNIFNIGDRVIIKEYGKVFEGIIDEEFSNGYHIKPTDGSIFDHGNFRVTGRHWVRKELVTKSNKPRVMITIDDALFED